MSDGLPSGVRWDPIERRLHVGPGIGNYALAGMFVALPGGIGAVVAAFGVGDGSPGRVLIGLALVSVGALVAVFVVSSRWTLSGRGVTISRFGRAREIPWTEIEALSVALIGSVREGGGRYPGVRLHLAPTGPTSANSRSTPTRQRLGTIRRILAFADAEGLIPSQVERRGRQWERIRRTG